MVETAASLMLVAWSQGCSLWRYSRHYLGSAHWMNIAMVVRSLKKLPVIVLENGKTFDLPVHLIVLE